MAPARRLELVQWATAHAALVIEDDYDAEFRYDRRPVGAVQGLDPGRVAHVGTASKTLAPGVRLGWVSLPAALVQHVRMRKMVADFWIPSRSISSRSRSSLRRESTSDMSFERARSTGGGGIASYGPS